MTKLTGEERNKIIDLWKHKRKQRKDKKQNSIFRRLSFIFIFVFINIFLIYFCFVQTSSDPLESIKIIGSDKVFLDELQIIQEPFWLLRINKKDIKKRIMQENPLIADIQIKPIIWDFGNNKAQLKIIVHEYISWAKFNNGWVLAFLPATGEVKIIKNTKNLDFDNLVFSSSAIISVHEKDYALWAREAKNIQKLIYLTSTVFPEKPLKAIFLGDEVKLYFDNLEVNLGKWNDEILDRASKLINLRKTLKKYSIISLDLRSESRAILKINEKDNIKEQNISSKENTGQE